MIDDDTAEGRGAGWLHGGAQAEDLLVLEEPFTSITLEALEHLFAARDGALRPKGTAHSGNAGSCGCGASTTRNRSRFGMRYFLKPEEGSGYWDTFMPLPHVHLTITDSTYRGNTWAHIAGEEVFKLRFLLAGEIRDEKARQLLAGPAASLTIHPLGCESGYFTTPNTAMRMVVLHCRPQVLSETLGLGREEMPTLLESLWSAGAANAGLLKLSMTPKIFDAAMDIVESRYRYSSPLRSNFLEAKSRELLCAVLGDLKTAEIGTHAGAPLSARELNRVLETRDYLASHFRKPPSIPVLARHVGVNQTRLKEIFKQVMGMTIHAYVQQTRMRRASEMLLTGEYDVSEVAYAAGYEHASNFTYAFKRFYGFLPRALKR